MKNLTKEVNRIKCVIAKIRQQYKERDKSGLSRKKYHAVLQKREQEKEWQDTQKTLSILTSTDPDDEIN